MSRQISLFGIRFNRAPVTLFVFLFHLTIKATLYNPVVSFLDGYYQPFDGFKVCLYASLVFGRENDFAVSMLDVCEALADHTARFVDAESNLFLCHLFIYLVHEILFESGSVLLYPSILNSVPFLLQV
ncbi:MAG TPA: hypothetical protein PK937_06055 [bacterium]|nr:hypothetical protein [bacterium]